MPSFRPLRRAAAMALALAILTPLPASALRQAAVSAPAPQSQAASPDAAYRAAATLLSAAGLKQEAIRTLWNRLAVTGQTLPDVPLTPAVLALMETDGFRTDRVNRYTALWETHPEYTAQQVVEQVHLDLDRPFYEGILPVTDPGDPLVLVNKYHALPADYVPQLEVLGSRYGTGSMTPEAAAAFRAMADAARAEGITLKSVSAYRSYRTQTNTYNRYLNQYSRELVDTFSARPGHSEHQTGLALDINAARISDHFENTAEFAWLQENCTRFGFLLRYPEGKSHITGYRFEPWHYRYVGAEAARDCTALGLTWEEYTARPAPAGSTAAADLLLEGVAYCTLSTLAAQTDGTVSVTHDRATLTAAGHTLTVTPGFGIRLDGLHRRLSAPALRLEGEFWLPRWDGEILLGLT